MEKVLCAHGGGYCDCLIVVKCPIFTLLHQLWSRAQECLHGRRQSGVTPLLGSPSLQPLILCWTNKATNLLCMVAQLPAGCVLDIHNGLLCSAQTTNTPRLLPTSSSMPTVMCFLDTGSLQASTEFRLLGVGLGYPAGLCWRPFQPQVHPCSHLCAGEAIFIQKITHAHSKSCTHLYY